jgi:hypothetical protein
MLQFLDYWQWLLRYFQQHFQQLLQASGPAAGCCAGLLSSATILIHTGPYLRITLLAGKYSDVSSASGNSAAQVAHGALMLVAFCVLMPAGMLLARHKWLFGDSEVR